MQKKPGTRKRFILQDQVGISCACSFATAICFKGSRRGKKARGTSGGEEGLGLLGLVVRI